jgi:hypothetical protein
MKETVCIPQEKKGTQELKEKWSAYPALMLVLSIMQGSYYMEC